MAYSFVSSGDVLGGTGWAANVPESPGVACTGAVRTAVATRRSPTRASPVAGGGGAGGGAAFAEGRAGVAGPVLGVAGPRGAPPGGGADGDRQAGAAVR